MDALHPAPIPIGQHFLITWKYANTSPSAPPSEEYRWAGKGTRGGGVEYVAEFRSGHWRHMRNAKEQPITRQAQWPPHPSIAVIALRPTHRPPIIVEEEPHQAPAKTPAKIPSAKQPPPAKPPTAKTLPAKPPPPAKPTITILKRPVIERQEEPTIIAQAIPQTTNAEIAAAITGRTAPAKRPPAAAKPPDKPEPPTAKRAKQPETKLPAKAPPAQQPAQVTPALAPTDSAQHQADDDDDDPLDELYADNDGISASNADEAAERTIEDLEDICHQYADAPPFQGGNGHPPPVAALKGADLIAYLRAPAAAGQIPALSMQGLVKSTHQEHRRMAQQLLEMPEDLRKAPLSTSVAEFLLRRRKSKNWKWATTVKYMATAQGLCSLLPLYVMSPAINLAACPVWRQALKAAARHCRRELPKQPKAATLHQVERTLRNEACLPTFAAILISWMTAARTGCVLQLQRSCVQLHDDRTLSVTFLRGKGALSRATAYTVHTPRVAQQFLPRLQKWLAERHSWLFPTTTNSKTIKEALRREDPALECRSLRRGALQALAQQPGISDETLMLFSGHGSVKTLRRYLNWGVKAAHTRTAMVNAAGSALATDDIAQA